MIINLIAVARVVPLTALMLAACVSQGHTNSRHGRPNDTPQSRAQNRRSEIVVEGAPGGLTPIGPRGNL
jgi:hypothetical protein